MVKVIDVNQIYCENCIDTMANMPNDYVDCTVTSPPYDNLRKYKGFSFDFENIARALYRVTKVGGVVIWVVGDATRAGSETGSSFLQALYFKSLGFNLHDTMIYRKSNYIPLTHNRYEQEFEYIFCFSKGKPKAFNPIKIPTKLGGKTYKTLRPRDYDGHAIRHNRDAVLTYKMEKIKGNIFEYVAGAGAEKTNHPATFPLQLAKDQIATWSNPNDLIYDPFAGSGTTLIAAKSLDRRYIGSEISTDYCAIVQKRLKI